MFIKDMICQSENNNNEEPHPVNEIHEYTAARYVTANEAIWHLFGYSISEQSPCIIR